MLKPIKFEEIAGWEAEDHQAAFEAFCVSAEVMASKPYKTRALGLDGNHLAEIGKRALGQRENTDFSPRRFFEEEFTPHLIVADDDKQGFLTGFFEPITKASRFKTDQFSVPLYRRPTDLINVSDESRPATLDPYFRFGRQTEVGIVAYHNRAAIQSGALEGLGLELAWLADKTDAFFIHVQGAAKLDLGEGEFLRVTYAAKTGHPYTSVAKVLCEQLHVEPSEMTADKLADWMRGNPEKIDGLLAHNESYIFFEEVDGLTDDEGPIAAAKTPLIPGRSLAVDRLLHTFGTPIWVTTEKPLPQEDRPFGHLMVAHDTGSAIVGAARGDIFIGSGDAAGAKAGRIRHSAEMTILAPRV